MYAFVLSGRKLQTVKLNGAGLMDDVMDFRRLIEKPGSSDFMDASRKLYNRLFQPIEGALGQRSLIIVPHGILHYLPMNALHDGRSYLIDRYSVSMMPSAGALKYLSKVKARKGGGVLIFGNPDLGEARIDLAYAEREARDVASLRSLHPKRGYRSGSPQVW